jgi:hypothetical protein
MAVFRRLALSFLPIVLDAFALVRDVLVTLPVPLRATLQGNPAAVL